MQNNIRIPRRGEIGWTDKEIGRLERLGYVMSGNRHKTMTSIRVRKENQVYKAEETRALMLYNYEKQQEKETAFILYFRNMIKGKISHKYI